MAVRSEQLVQPPYDYIQVSAGAPASDVILPAGTKGLLFGVAGTVNVEMVTGAIRTGIPVEVGILPGFFAVLKGGGTASNIWALI